MDLPRVTLMTNEIMLFVPLKFCYSHSDVSENGLLRITPKNNEKDECNRRSHILSTLETDTINSAQMIIMLDASGSTEIKKRNKSILIVCRIFPLLPIRWHEKSDYQLLTFHSKPLSTAVGRVRFQSINLFA